MFSSSRGLERAIERGFSGEEQGDNGHMKVLSNISVATGVDEFCTGFLTPVDEIGERLTMLRNP